MKYQITGGDLLTAPELLEHDLYDCEDDASPTLQAAQVYWLHVEAKKGFRLWHKRFCRCLNMYEWN